MRYRTGETLGNYRLLKLVGRGGYAEVYLAEHIYLKTQAAVKLLHGNLSEKDIEDFLREARTIAGLKHPHIVRIYDFGIENREPYIVMDYAPNKTLRDLYPRGTTVPFAEILRYTKQVGDALTYTHQHKLIHRDVKPENILLDEHNQVLLSDFGIAAIAHRAESMEAQTAIGTVQYMAPEQLQGYPTPASDQYSLGIVVYEWLCGTRPFSGSNFVEIGMKQATEPVPSLCQKVPSLSSEVEQVVLKALEKDQQQRFPSIRDFVLALEEAIGKDTVKKAKNVQTIDLDKSRQPLKVNGEQIRDEQFARFQAVRVIPPTQPAKIAVSIPQEEDDSSASIRQNENVGQIHRFEEQKVKPTYNTPLIKRRLSRANLIHFACLSILFSWLLHNWILLIAGLCFAGILAWITGISVEEHVAAGDQKMTYISILLIFPIAWGTGSALFLATFTPSFLSIPLAILISLLIGLFGHLIIIIMALPAADFNRKK